MATTASPSLVRFTIPTPDGAFVGLENAIGGAARLPLAISPDGRHVVMVDRDMNGRARLWIRALASLAARECFYADGQLKKLAIAGGIPERADR